VAGSNIGKPCTPSTKCGTGLSCLLTELSPPYSKGGVCSMSCTPDDPKTLLVNEDTCPGKGNYICLPDTYSIAKGGHQCFKKCTPKLGANDCDKTVACVLTSPHHAQMKAQSACARRGCVTGEGCPVLTGLACTPGKPGGCPTGQQCVTLPWAPSIGRCARAGKCDVTSGLCAAHALGKKTAKVGDPCSEDKDCAGNMHCMLQRDQSSWLLGAGATCTTGQQCCSGSCQFGKCAPGPCPTLYRNGYCTIKACVFGASLTHRKCPAGSACNRWFTGHGGLCQKTCDLKKASTCRGHSGDIKGDYECRAWNRVQIKGTAMALSPVCDMGPAPRCDQLTPYKVSCSSLGLVGNPTKMQCRDLVSFKPTTPGSPTGACYDDTGSGK